MSTELTDPVSDTATVTTQDINNIMLDMEQKCVNFHIVNRKADGSVYSQTDHSNPFSNMGPTQQQDIRDVLDNTRQYARSIGVLGEGDDSDDISG